MVKRQFSGFTKALARQSILGLPNLREVAPLVDIQFISRGYSWKSQNSSLMTLS